MIIMSAYNNIYLILLPLFVQLKESATDPLDELTINVNIGDNFIGPTVNCGVKRKGTELKDPNSRIVGGTETEINEYPWIAQVEHDGFFICGGSVIAATWILTTANCICDTRMHCKKLETLEIIIGEHNTTSATETNITKRVKPNWMIIHPDADWADDRTHPDIALLKIPPIDIKTYTPVCLPSQGADYTDKNAWVYGWGYQRLLPYGDLSPVLLDVQVPVVSDAEAAAKYAAIDVYMSDAELELWVFAGEVGKDSCTGDSGGPLTYANPANHGRHEQIGIVSWGHGCGDNEPGGYTEVAAVRSWIEDWISGKELELPAVIKKSGTYTVTDSGVIHYFVIGGGGGSANSGGGSGFVSLGSVQVQAGDQLLVTVGKGGGLWANGAWSGLEGPKGVDVKAEGGEWQVAGSSGWSGGGGWGGFNGRGGRGGFNGSAGADGEGEEAPLAGGAGQGFKLPTVQTKLGKLLPGRPGLPLGMYGGGAGGVVLEGEQSGPGWEGHAGEGYGAGGACNDEDECIDGTNDRYGKKGLVILY